MAKAENMASIPLDNPDTKSPDIVSLKALVIATPGTKDIMEPMIIISIFRPKPIVVDMTDKKEASAAPIKLLTKKVILYLSILFMVISTIKLII